MSAVEFSEEYKQEIKVEWLGVDGALCALYAGLAVFYGYGMLHAVNWIIGWAAPLIAIGITTGVFLRYLTQVFSFARKTKKKV